MEDQRKILMKSCKPEHFSPNRSEIVEIPPVEFDEKVHRQPRIIASFETFGNSSRIKVIDLDWQCMQTDRAALRQTIGGILLLSDSAQIAHHLDMETLQELLIFEGQAGKVIGTVNQPGLHKAVVGRLIAANIAKIDSLGKRYPPSIREKGALCHIAIIELDVIFDNLVKT